MPLKTPKWEEAAPGVKVLRLYRTKLNADWPRIVILELTADKFSEFEHDPLGFDKKYKIYPEQPMRWVSSCSLPPEIEGIRPVRDGAYWTVVLLHAGASRVTCSACPHEPA